MFHYSLQVHFVVIKHPIDLHQPGASNIPENEKAALSLARPFTCSSDLHAFVHVSHVYFNDIYRIGLLNNPHVPHIILTYISIRNYMAIN